MSKKSELLPNKLKLLPCNCSYCKKHRLQYEQLAFTEDGTEIASMLRQLSKIKARAGFAQKMSALYALELERETVQRNKSWLQRKNGVRLPDLRSDIGKDLF